MGAHLPIRIQAQPDETTCGPTCLHAVYDYYGDSLALDELIAEVSTLPEGGTLGVFLGCHALRRGYRATLYTNNLYIYDPTWFAEPKPDLRRKLMEQVQAKPDPKLQTATDGYVEFIDLGGCIRLEDLTENLIRHYLQRDRPLLTGLSATYLYQMAREVGSTGEPDDVRGDPVGHFVVLSGYDPDTHDVVVADPLESNPLADRLMYSVRIERLISAILLGVITYDANLLVIEPAGETEPA